jgi:hypothetical protein
VVAKYRNNEISSTLYPDVVYRASRFYNDAFALVETNDVGKQVVDMLFMDLAYENVLMTQSNGRLGQQLTGGFGGGKSSLGIKQSVTTKRIGCQSLKTLIEMDRLLVNDMHIKNEMTTFVAKKTSYEAEPGKHDDLMMCLVMFGWLVHQPYFRELTNTNVRRDLVQSSEIVDSELTPFGFIQDGRESEEDVYYDF